MIHIYVGPAGERRRRCSLSRHLTDVAANSDKLTDDQVERFERLLQEIAAGR